MAKLNFSKCHNWTLGCTLDMFGLKHASCPNAKSLTRKCQHKHCEHIKNGTLQTDYQYKPPVVLPVYAVGVKVVGLAQASLYAVGLFSDRKALWPPPFFSSSFIRAIRARAAPQG